MCASRTFVVALCLIGCALAGQSGEEEGSLLQLSAQKSAPDADPTSPSAASLAECEKDIEDCIAFGDPHFLTFDGGELKFHGRKDFYLVKSESITVQGRSLSMGGNLRGLAISGSFINDKVLTINAVGTDKHGSVVEVKLDGRDPFQKDGESISEFSNPDISGRHDIATTLSNKEKMRLKTQKATLDNRRFQRAFNRKEKAWLFQFGTKHSNESLSLLVTAYDQLTAVLTMRGVFGQDGYCGNFNRDKKDDTLDKLKERGFDGSPGDTENLFLKYDKSPIPSKYDGCRATVPTGKAAKKYMIDKKDDVPIGDKEACADFCMGFATAEHFDLATKASKNSYATCRCFPAIYGATKKSPAQSRVMCDLTRDMEHTCETQEELVQAKKVCALVDAVDKQGCLDDEAVAVMKRDCISDFCETGDHYSSVNAAAAEEAVKMACSSSSNGKNWGHLKKLLQKKTK